MSLCILITVSFPFLRKRFYEVLTKIHQSLSILLAYSIWRHLITRPLLPRIYVYVFTTSFLTTLLLECSIVIYRNGATSRGLPKALIINVKDRLLAQQTRVINQDVLRIRITMPRPLKVEAGQYVGLWMPGVSFWSFAQIHPFTVTSWSEEKQEILDLFIEPRKGMTRKLLLCTGSDNDLSTHYTAFVTGPHGTTAPVGIYETIVMIADGFGIVPQLPYLKQLIYGYNACKTKTRRIHLVWQLKTNGVYRISRRT